MDRVRMLMQKILESVGMTEDNRRGTRRKGGGRGDTEKGADS